MPITDRSTFNKGNAYFALAQILLYSEIKQNYEEKALLEESDPLGLFKKWNSEEFINTAKEIQLKVCSSEKKSLLELAI